MKPRQKKEAKYSLLPYTKPEMRTEKISLSFFRERSLQDELSGFNLLAATESDLSDDY